MTDDASLDDFLDSDDGGEPESSTGERPESAGDTDSAPTDDAATGDEAADDSAATDTANAATAGVDAATAGVDDGTTGVDDDTAGVDDDSEVAPIRGTFDWSPDGAACESCGASADRRWRDGDAMVCADCKEW